MANTRQTAMRQNPDAWMAARERLENSANQILNEMADLGLVNHKWSKTFIRRFKKQHPHICIRTNRETIKLCFDSSSSAFLIIEDVTQIDDLAELVEFQ